jgi:hypothetical protein
MGEDFSKIGLTKLTGSMSKRTFSVAIKAEVSSKRPVKYKIWSFSREQCFTSESLPNFLNSLVPWRKK